LALNESKAEKVEDTLQPKNIGDLYLKKVVKKEEAKVRNIKRKKKNTGKKMKMEIIENFRSI